MIFGMFVRECEWHRENKRTKTKFLMSGLG